VGFSAQQRRADAAGAATRGRGCGQNSIAVLPFVNMSGDATQEYPDGLTEELLNVLAQLPELRVASRTSAFAFKGREVGIDSIAKALRVAHVLEGSVRQAGQRVKITAQLIDAGSGYHLWSDTYERDYQDIFAIQEEISQAIVASLKLRLSAERADSAFALPETSDPEAHRLVLQGMAEARVSNEGAAPRTSGVRGRAGTRPGLPAGARAAGGGDLRYGLPRHPARRGWLRPGEARGRASAGRGSGQRGCPRDPGPRGRLAGLGTRSAEAHFRQALERNPNHAARTPRGAWLLMRLGQREEAIEEAKRAVELDLLSPARHNNLGALYTYSEQYDQGIAALRTALTLAPEATNVLGNLALTHLMTGRLDEALKFAEQARAVDSTDTFVFSVLGMIHAKAGRRGEAEQMLRLMDALPV
jgi:serine/threonine-protein kinase